MELGQNNNLTHRHLAAWKPKVDISEVENLIYLIVELPGVRKEDVQIDLQDRVLTIRGERHVEKKVENETWHRREISHGTFARSFNVGQVLAEQIQAEMKEGILEIKFPKVQEQPRPQGNRVEIQTASA
jgi:HSP20 family protein